MLYIGLIAAQPKDTRLTISVKKYYASKEPVKSKTTVRNII